MKTLLIALFAFTISACATTADSLKVGTNALLLEGEFAQVRDLFRDEDLTLQERLDFEKSVAVYEDIRIDLHQLADGKVTSDLVVKVATAGTMLEQLRTAFLHAEKVVIGYYSRQNVPVPIDFLHYRSSAVTVYDALSERVHGQEQAIPWEEMTEILSLAVRSYLVINTGIGA